MAFNQEWSHDYAAKVLSCLQKDVFPTIGQLPIQSIQASQLRPIILAIADRNARTVAILVRQWLGQIFSYAQAHGYCDHHPAQGFRGLVKKAPTRHHPPLGWNDISDFFQRLDQWHGRAPTKLALRLLALTFVRTGELRQAQWQEFDLANGLWHIPASRMKMRRPHIVPLSRQTLTLLQERRDINKDSDFLLPKQRQGGHGVIGRSSLNRAIACLGYAGRFSAHGFRATATTMPGLLGYPEKQIDLQLAYCQQAVPHDLRNRLKRTAHQPLTQPGMLDRQQFRVSKIQ